MRCALVIPAWQPEELFPTKTAASQINYWQPLGTLYVAAALQLAGHDVRFYNGAFMTHDDIMRGMDEFAPLFVGIYSTTFGWTKAMAFAKALKASHPATFTCTGGPYPIAVQRECLREAEGAIDAVVSGEGEITVPELVERLEHNQPLHGVLGVLFRDGDTIVDNGTRPLIENLDSIAFPARELLGESARYLPPPATYRRKPVAVMITSRGCNRRCIFCSQIDQERKSGKRGVRFRSVDNVLAEIEWCLNHGYREIKFIDDTLAADYDRLMHLCDEIRKRRLDFTWFASACANQVDRPLLKAMKKAGCWAILFGAESGVQRNLNTLRKATTLEQIRTAVKAAKSVGLRVSTPFLFGIPGETYEDALKTIEFAIELNPDIANFHALTAFPGTHLYNNLDKYGSISGDRRDFTYQGASFVPFTMTRQQILELRQLAFRRFYSRPRFLVRRALQMRSWNDVRAAAAGLRSLFWLWAAKGLFDRDRNRSTVSSS